MTARRRRAARSPRHPAGARGRRLDGRHDRADPRRHRAGPRRVAGGGDVGHRPGVLPVAGVAGDPAGLHRARRRRVRRGEAGLRGPQRRDLQRPELLAAGSRAAQPRPSSWPSAATTRPACCGNSTRCWAPAACWASAKRSPRRRWCCTARTTRCCGSRHGRAVAAAIPGARFVVIDGMGHDLPEPVWRPILEALTENFARAGRPVSGLTEIGT